MFLIFLTSVLTINYLLVMFLYKGSTINGSMNTNGVEEHHIVKLGEGELMFAIAYIKAFAADIDFSEDMPIKAYIFEWTPSSGNVVPIRL